MDRPVDSVRLKRLLTYHFDLELMLKYRELKLLELELERGREVRACLEKLLVNEVVYPDRYTRQEYSLFSASNSGNSGLKRAASMPGLVHGNQQIVPQADSKYQYEMRADGSIVRLRCPACMADKFKSMLGFLNHCRIHCHIVFTSPEDRQQRAGVVVDPSVVPADFFHRHPTILKQEQDLAIIRADLQPIFSEAILSPGPTKADDAGEVESKLLGEPLPGEVTRFCIHKRIVIGNEAKCLKQLTAMDSKYTHSWRLYLRAPPPNLAGQRDSLSRWIRFVRFHLHPSYSDPIVGIHSEPFELQRETFGEFPVRVQLHFWDAKRNPPFDIIHHVKVFQAVVPGRTVAGPERMYEVELDRNTDFSSSLVGSIPSACASMPSSTRTRSDYDILGGALEGSTSSIELKGDNPLAVEAAKVACCEGIRDQIRMWNAAFCLSAEEILSWISVNRPDYFESRQSEDTVLSQQPRSFLPTRFCCYCGQTHEPAHRFELLQKNCSFKPRKVRLSSRTDLSSFVHGRYILHDTPQLDDSRYSSGQIAKCSIDLSKYSRAASLIETAHEDKLASDARLVCSALISVFARRLIARAIAVANDAGTRPSNDRPVMLTPLHIYAALTTPPALTDNCMDFITQENMQA